MEKVCVFCNRDNFEKNLITETKDFYLLATLGQITDGGCTLIVPKAHFPCIGAMPKNGIELFSVFISKVREAVEKEYGIQPTLFEHGVVGQTIPHAHLHLLPASLHFTPKVRADFPLAEIDSFHALEALRIHSMANEPYLFWQSPNSMMHCCWNPPAPPQYFRDLAAKMLNRPERADWRKMDRELDKRLRSETVRRLKPHFA